MGWTWADEILFQAAIESQRDALQQKVTELEKQLEAAKAAQPVPPAEGAPAGTGEKESELQAKLEALQKEKDELDKVSKRRIGRIQSSADPARSDTRTTSPKSIASTRACEIVLPTSPRRPGRPSPVSPSWRSSSPTLRLLRLRLRLRLRQLKAVRRVKPPLKPPLTKRSGLPSLRARRNWLLHTPRNLMPRDLNWHPPPESSRQEQRAWTSSKLSRRKSRS